MPKGTTTNKWIGSLKNGNLLLKKMSRRFHKNLHFHSLNTCDSLLWKRLPKKNIKNEWKINIQKIQSRWTSLHTIQSSSASATQHSSFFISFLNTSWKNIFISLDFMPDFSFPRFPFFHSSNIHTHTHKILSCENFVHSHTRKYISIATWVAFPSNIFNVLVENSVLKIRKIRFSSETYENFSYLATVKFAVNSAKKYKILF